MSAFTHNIIGKRRSDDDSSSDSDEYLPSVKKKRSCNGETNIKQSFTSTFLGALKWIFDLPLKPEVKEAMLAEAASAQVIDVDDNDEEICIDDEDEEDIVAIDDTPEVPLHDQGHSSYLRDSSHNGIPKPVTTSTPYYPHYKDGTRVGLRTDISPMIVFENNVPKTKGNLQKQHRSNGRCIAPITNPGLDVEILLDSRDIGVLYSDEMKIVSEIDSGKQSSKFFGPVTPSVFDGASVEPKDASRRSAMNGRDPSTSRQSSISSSKRYTAHDVVRLQEKQMYGLLLDKIVKNSAYRPMVKKETTTIQVDLTQDESEDSVMAMPFKKEYLEKHVGDFIKEYYKPCQLVTKVKTNITQPKKSSERKEVKEEISPVLPEFRFKTKTKPDFFDAAWINELKTSINEETVKRMDMVKQEEDKIKRYKERREAKSTEEKRLFEKYKVPGDVFPEISTETTRNDFPEITAEMESIINAALEIPQCANENEPLSTLLEVTVTRRHMVTLLEGTWLMDEVLNFYINLIVERSKLDNYPSVYTYSTFFYSSLKQRGVNRVLRWTRVVNIFSFDIVMVPLHCSNVHWALCVIDNRHKTVRYFDSMNSQQDSCLRYMREYLVAEKKHKLNIDMSPDEYTFETVKNLPKQMNGSDCGMFTLKYAEYISRDAPITFKQAHISYFRRRMVYEIMTKQLL